MIKVTPVMDAEEIMALCEKEGIGYEDNSLCYYIYINGILGGICLFKFIKGGGRIITLRNTKGTEDRAALVIAGKACLDVIERHSGFDAYFEDTDKVLARALGFKEKEGKEYLDLHGYFDGCGGCGSDKK